MKLLMLKGLPGSGKSTWAKQFVLDNILWLRINKDSMREMLGGRFTSYKERIVLAARDFLVAEALARWDSNVIVDDTNFDPKHEARLRELAEHYGAIFEIKSFDTPLEECIARDAKRPNPVGEKVIKKMWRDYVYVKPTPPPYDPALPWAIVCDLDGTLAIHNGRGPYDTAECETDRLNDRVAGILRRWSGRVVFVSGREDRFQQQTYNWLSGNGIIGSPLHMRPTGDMRRDDIVKQEIYDREIKGQYNVEFVLDDRDRVVQMWRKNGLTCLQVADGDF